jgi:hypothetical protein
MQLLRTIYNKNNNENCMNVKLWDKNGSRLKSPITGSVTAAG